MVFYVIYLFLKRFVHMLWNDRHVGVLLTLTDRPFHQVEATAKCLGKSCCWIIPTCRVALSENFALISGVVAAENVRRRGSCRCAGPQPGRAM